MITHLILDEFYKYLNKEFVLIFASLDVDSVCASKIISNILQSDNVQHSIVPIADRSTFKDVYKEYALTVTNIILINFGANFDIVEFIHPEAHSKFFVLDYHRPIDIYNIYNANQVIVLVPQEEEQAFPDYHDIFYNEEVYDNEEDEELENRGNVNKVLKSLKEQKKRLRHEENKQKILFEYTEYTHFADPTSLLLFNLSWMLSRDSNMLLWCAVLGLTNHYVNEKYMRQEKYLLELSKLKNHIQRLNHKKEVDKEKVVIRVVADLNLCLYRHWTLFDSLYYSPNMACHFKVWTTKGRKRLNEFLADMGIPLSQSKQKFLCMDFEYRRNAKAWIEEFAEKYGIEDINYPSFSISFGYNKRFGATDYTFALNAILENKNSINENSPNEKQNQNFFYSLDCLTTHAENFEYLYRGIELAKLQTRLIFEETLSVLDTHQILTVGPFLYASLPEHSANSVRFLNQNLLRRLAHFLLYAYHAKTNNQKKTKNLPLAIAVPQKLSDGEKSEFSTIIGIPPISILETSSKNFLGKAFEQAALTTHTTYGVRQFDPTIINIKNRDKSKFFDALISMLD